MNFYEAVFSFQSSLWFVLLAGVYARFESDSGRYGSLQQSASFFTKNPVHKVSYM